MVSTSTSTLVVAMASTVNVAAATPASDPTKAFVDPLWVASASGTITATPPPAPLCAEPLVVVVEVAVIVTAPLDTASAPLPTDASTAPLSVAVALPPPPARMPTEPTMISASVVPVVPPATRWVLVTVMPVDSSTMAPEPMVAVVVVLVVASARSAAMARMIPPAPPSALACERVAASAITSRTPLATVTRAPLASWAMVWPPTFDVALAPAPPPLRPMAMEITKS